MSSTETEERTNGQTGNEAEQQGNGQSGSGAMKALKIGALAAAAGTAAYAASKAITPSDSGDEGESKNGGGGGGSSSSSRTSMDQIVSAIGSSRWEVLRDLIVPFAENGARSAGAFVATDTPDILSETLVPKFIEGFAEAKGKKTSD